MSDSTHSSSATTGRPHISTIKLRLSRSRHLLLLCIACAVVVVMLGAFTRLVDAGLGCPDWPTCYGHMWVPTTEADIAQANVAFAHAPVEIDKTWPEQIHRIFASTLGSMILILWVVAVRRRDRAHPYKRVATLLGLLVIGTALRIPLGESMDWVLLALVVVYFAHIIQLALTQGVSHHYPFKLVSFVAGFVVLQGLFGMWTVTLNLWPQVVTAHLLGGFTTLALLWLLLQRLNHWQWTVPSHTQQTLSRITPFAMVALVVVSIQIALGGWTSSNYAALACSDLPQCHGAWIPVMDFAEGFNIFQHIGPNYLGGLMDSEGRIAIHYSHRMGALITVLAISYLAWKLWSSGVFVARRMSVILLLVLTTQVLLGLSNIWWSLPLWVAVSHNAVGALLLLTMVTINHRLRTLTVASLSADPANHNNNN